MRNRYLLKMIQASLEAGREILDVYHSDFEVEHKKDNSPLTLADKKSNDVIMNYLSGFDIPVLSEEGRAIPYAERKAWKKLWVVDPLDGTKEFVKKNGEFTVNIALVENENPVLGVIYLPVKRVLYFASDDAGAFKYSVASGEFPENLTLSTVMGASRKLPLNDTRKEMGPERVYRIVGSRSHATPELKTFVDEKRQKYKNVEFVSAGSSLKLCLVAEGKADIYPRLGPTMEWDTAAGQVIAENAGRVVTRHDTKERLTYNKEDLLNPWFIVE
jgi:3'(2'), 5'-bisphosphate nucleotidase